LDLHNKVSEAQLRQANLSEPEEDELVPPVVPKESNESTAELRNRLFANHEEVKETSSENALQHHRMMQDELSEAMLGMARGLKQRTIAFGEALREDSKVFPEINVTNK
jgi:Membrane fusion protein Use1